MAGSGTGQAGDANKWGAGGGRAAVGPWCLRVQMGGGRWEQWHLRMQMGLHLPGRAPRSLGAPRGAAAVLLSQPGAGRIEPQPSTSTPQPWWGVMGGVWQAWGIPGCWSVLATTHKLHLPVHHPPSTGQLLRGWLRCWLCPSDQQLGAATGQDSKSPSAAWHSHKSLCKT